MTTARRYLDKATASLSELVLPNTTRQLLASLRQTVFEFVAKYVAGLRICNRSGVGAECAFVLPPARAVAECAFVAPVRAELLLP